jgi:hypothetical protein
MASRPLSCTKTEQALALLGAAVRDVQTVLREAAPGSVSGDEAKAFVDLFAKGERAAASGIALYAPRVVETGAHAKDGHASAADWLGSVAGSSPTAAKERLASARRAGAEAALTEALHEGELSSAELKVMSEAEAAVPGGAKTLLDLAGGGASHQELSDTASLLRAAARSKESDAARRQRVHERRHFRWRQSPEGGVRGEFSCDEVAWARVAPKLEAEAKARWKAAGSSEHSTLEVHRLDAFLDFMAEEGPGNGGGAGDGAGRGASDANNDWSGDDWSGEGWSGDDWSGDDEDDNSGAGSGPPTGSGPGSGPTCRPKRSRVQTLVIIDAEALRRGTTEGDEICEIEGIGPVSVAAAVELLGEGALRFLVKRASTSKR